MLINLIIGAILGYIVYTNHKNRTGNHEQALVWALAVGVVTFLHLIFGIIFLIVYFVVASYTPAKKMPCPSCHKENEPTAKVCQYCGWTLVTEEKKPTSKHCPKCSRQFDADSRFCPQCGVELEDKPAAPVPGSGFMKVCPSCQSNNMGHRDLCWKCGHHFNEPNKSSE